MKVKKVQALTPPLVFTSSGVQMLFPDYHIELRYDIFKSREEKSFKTILNFFKVFAYKYQSNVHVWSNLFDENDGYLIEVFDSPWIQECVDLSIPERKPSDLKHYILHLDDFGYLDVLAGSFQYGPEIEGTWKSEAEILEFDLSDLLHYDPWYFELSFDEGGLVDIEDLYKVLRLRKERWSYLGKTQFLKFLEQFKRDEVKILDNKVKVIGILPFTLKMKKDCPPDYLYYGAKESNIERILKNGFEVDDDVNYSFDIYPSNIIWRGQQKGINPITLQISAYKAFKKGIDFYLGSNNMWILRSLPAKYVSLYEPEYS